MTIVFPSENWYALWWDKKWENGYAWPTLNYPEQAYRSNGIRIRNYRHLSCEAHTQSGRCRDLESRHLFANGNIADSFTYFGDQHICNQFCKWYQLREVEPTSSPVKLQPKGLAIFQKEIDMFIAGKRLFQLSDEDGQVSESGRSILGVVKRRRVDLAGLE